MVASWGQMSMSMRRPPLAVEQRREVEDRAGFQSDSRPPQDQHLSLNLAGRGPMDCQILARLPRTLADTHRILTFAHATLTLAYSSLRNDWHSVRNSCKINKIRKVVNVCFGNITHWRTERRERRKGQSKWWNASCRTNDRVCG